MGRLEEMLLRSGSIYRGADGTNMYIEGNLIKNSAGWVTHRIERAANGVDLVAVNVATNSVDASIIA